MIETIKDEQTVEVKEDEFFITRVTTEKFTAQDFAQRYDAIKNVKEQRVKESEEIDQVIELLKSNMESCEKILAKQKEEQQNMVKEALEKEKNESN